ncbi:putative sugar transporter STL1 [Hortaea werneckii]|nr:putative sugar transporter STL1 [Hortaea werneckii]KAI7057361.1 putative sugar transporter STL1 [Hortaea werneckii]KAI7206790.1 putative sugar transporter STL1 [Hortaea werneckii]KAI7315147.1 putative sugar transporter STL1 [Hortaea werneckii]KAI7385844.1 putative sugar transporter STL1 [Hortaea werneckii]
MFSKLQGKALYQTMSTACGAAFMLYGYDAGVLGGFQERQEFRDAIGDPQGPFIIPLIASIYNLAAGFMSLAVPFFGMQIGRKGTIQLGHLLVCLGALLQSSAYSLAQITVGRIVAGFGIGCIASAVPTYMAEMSLEASQRGPETQYQLALLISGIPLAYWIDLGFVQGLEQHPYLWRFPLAMQSCFSIFSGGLLLFLPDTPRWYYARDRHEEGDKTLARLHGKDVSDEAVQTMRREILASLHEDDGEKSEFNIMMLFWDNSDLQIGRRLRTSFLILFAQQFLGINMLVYFSTQIFSSIGYGPLLSGILAAVMNTIFGIASFPPIWFIERIGRRPLMFWCAIGCGVLMIIYVVITTTGIQGDDFTTLNRTKGWASTAIIILYVVVFAFGWLGTCWIYGPEIAPLRYRHIAGGLGAAGEWFSTWAMVFGGGSGLSAVGPIIFIWPLICCFLSAAYVWYYCPETTGRTLEEIDVLFAKSPEVRARLEMETERRQSIPREKGPIEDKEESDQVDVEKNEFA